MHIKHSTKKSIILGIIFLTAIGLTLPNIIASVETDPVDGVWMDNFENDDDVNLTDCTIENGAIVLNRSINEITYDFADGRSHKAYGYVAPFFLPLLFSAPDSHIRWEDEFNEYTDLEYIKTLNGEYAERSSEGLRRYVVHHFRFKLDAKAEDIGSLGVNWFGNATDDQRIELYLWQYFPGQTRFGAWCLLDRNQSDERKGDVILSSGIISHDNIDLALNKDNYLDIFVVASPRSIASKCTLYTDYVEISSEIIEGYTIGYGTAITKDYIDPKTISNISKLYWEILTWEDYEREGATVKYHVLYEDETGNPAMVEDKYLNGNEDGFTDPPVCLNKIPYDKLKIMANLSTDTFLVSPKIFSWAIIWQTDTNRWQDLFNYTFRIDEKNKVTISDGKVNIEPVRGDWPLLHQNTQNTRCAEGEGPDNNNLNWYSIIKEGKRILDPVVRDGVLYTTYLKSDQLYIYNNIIKPEEEYVKEYDVVVDLNTDKWVVNSPAITEDSIIIATGKTDNDGTKNYVIALDKTKPKNEPDWEFVYDEDICYSSSPVVADDKVFITSWSGDPDIFQSNENNKVIALDLSSGSQLWEYDLPAGSFSTPAIYKNMVFVGCSKKRGDSLFALDIESGDKIWSKSVGAIGEASPVVYNDTVFVMSKFWGKIKLTALSADNGSVLWTKFVCYSIFASADSTPAVYDDVLYVASPNGRVFALDVEDGSELWSKRVYRRRWFDFLVTSPAYADGMVFIGSPAGTFYALDASDGKINWTFETFQPRDNFAVVTSPVVSNGLVFFGDENGKLYSIGSFKPPDQEIEGSIISIPIKLPQQGYWWDKFYAHYNTSEDNSITFSILDEDKNFIKEIQNGGTITGTIARTIRLRADLYAKNVSVNPQLFDWGVTFQEDRKPPFLDESTFTPEGGWINETTHVFTIEAMDNITGLLVSSAQYVLEYSIENETHIGTFDANCTGENGTTDVELITVNISTLEFYQNITELHSIKISIYDLAGNKASFVMPLKYLKNQG